MLHPKCPGYTKVIRGRTHRCDTIMAETSRQGEEVTYTCRRCGLMIAATLVHTGRMFEVHWGPDGRKTAGR